MQVNQDGTVDYLLPRNCWIVKEGFELDIAEGDVGFKTLGERYWMGFFRSLSQMLCIGYGLSPPEDFYDLLCCMWSMISGAIVFAIFVGNVTSLIQTSEASKQSYAEKFMHVKEYMNFRNFPSQLRHRVQAYYEHRFQGKSFDEDMILDDLNPILRSEIRNYNCRALVVNVPLFTFCDEEIRDFISQNLEFEAYLPNDCIVPSGGKPRGLFLLARGSVRIELKEFDYVTQTLCDGDFFGELSLLLPQLERNGSVVASTACHLYLLSHDLFELLIATFKNFRKQIRQGFLAYCDDLEQKIAEVPKNIMDLVDEEREKLLGKDKGPSRAPSADSDISGHSGRTSKIQRISQLSKRVTLINRQARKDEGYG